MPVSGSFLTVLILCAAVAICLSVCAYADPLGRWLKVMDYPSVERKRHEHPTPQVGGIAIMLALAFWIAAMLFAGFGNVSLLVAILLCGAGVTLVGLTDDQSSTTPLVRLLSLAVFLGIAFVIAPELLTSTIRWGNFEPTTIVPWAYYMLAGFAVVGLVNAVNMADGQNGVVLSMFMIWSLCLLTIGDNTIAAVAVVVLIAAAVAFVFNVRGKLFLGDGGTYGVTFVLALLSIYAHARGEVKAGTVIVWYFIPVADCLRLLISRPLHGKSPLNGDRDHFHHRLEDKLGKHLGLATYAGTVGVASVVSTLAPQFALVCLTVLTAVYFSFAGLTDSEKVATGELETGDAQDQWQQTNIVAFGTDGLSGRKHSGMV